MTTLEAQLVSWEMPEEQRTSFLVEATERFQQRGASKNSSAIADGYSLPASIMCRTSLPSRRQQATLATPGSATSLVIARCVSEHGALGGAWSSASQDQEITASVTYV